MRVLLSTLLVASAHAALSRDFSIEFYAGERRINSTAPNIFVHARVSRTGNGLSEQERELYNVALDGSGFTSDGCKVLGLQPARAVGDVTTEYDFFRTHAYQGTQRISLTGYIRIDLYVWPNATVCTITARENRFRWSEEGIQVANAERMFSLPVVVPPDEAEPDSARNVLAWLGLLLTVLLLLLLMRGQHTANATNNGTVVAMRGERRTQGTTSASSDRTELRVFQKHGTGDAASA